MLVWKAISSMVLMILAMSSLERLMSSMAETIHCIPSIWGTPTPPAGKHAGNRARVPSRAEIPQEVGWRCNNFVFTGTFIAPPLGRGTYSRCW